MVSLSNNNTTAGRVEKTRCNARAVMETNVARVFSKCTSLKALSLDVQVGAQLVV
jgi:hypothetical protein